MNTSARQDAFTLIELLVVVLALTALSAILVPRLAKAHSTASVFGAQCLNNQHQLAAAALMYADDNQDSWMLNTANQGPTWCGDVMNYNSANTDNTNLAVITNKNFAVIASYIQKPQILHCPSDQSFVVGEGRRVRSVSMNGAVGTTPVSYCNVPAGGPVNGQFLSGQAEPCQFSYQTYGRTWQMNAPKPSMLWIFADVNPTVIQNCSLLIPMVPSVGFVYPLPANYHAGSGSFSFADGHAELHPWGGPLLLNPPSINVGIGVESYNPTAADLNDLAWLQQRTSAKIP